MTNIYGYCAQCGFGIEVNVYQTRYSTTTVHADFYFELDGNVWCYWCYEKRTPRTVAELKRLLAESEVLLASAKRVSDGEAIIFYFTQVNKARAALNLEAPAPEPQGNLF